MLTPAFEINQDDSYVIIHIRAPFAKVSESEIYFQDYDFKFYSKPYFLRLNLPGRVEENGNETANYDVDAGSFTIKLPKVTPGEWFEGLDLQTKLLAPRHKPTTTGPLIEVIGECTNFCEDDDEEFDWQVDQILWTEQDEMKLQLGTVKYGFANQYCESLFRLQEEVAEILDVQDPSHTSCYERHERRLQTDSDHFNDDHYLADLYQDESIKRVLEFTPSWTDQLRKMKANSHCNPDDIVCFTNDELNKMRNLPNKEYLIDKKTKCSLLLGLVDILFAYAYNIRTTEGENTVESSWTVCKLSATFSWFECFTSLEAVAMCAVQRSLCYPLYRHWTLAMTVLQDVKQILSLGVKYVLKCLLEIHSLFNGGDNYYILNNLYVTDYCVWIQSVRSSTLIRLGEALEKIKIQKQDVGFDLEELEQGAVLALKEEASQVTNAAEDSCSSEDESSESSDEESLSSEDEICTSVHSRTPILKIEETISVGPDALSSMLEQINLANPDLPE